MRNKSTMHEETKQRIVKAARALVLEGGHETLSLREIARRAGFGPASLYEYFDGREAILATLAREAAGSLTLALEKATKKTSARRAAPGALVALGLAYVAWAKAHSEDFLLLFHRLPSKRQSLAEGAPQGSAYGVVLDAVRRASVRGEVEARGEPAIEGLAYALWASAHGMAMLQLTHLSTFDADFASADRAALEALVAGWKG
jgi:AcrR family transcriptional regulator